MTEEIKEMLEKNVNENGEYIDLDLPDANAIKRKGLWLNYAEEKDGDVRKVRFNDWDEVSFFIGKIIRSKKRNYASVLAFEGTKKENEIFVFNSKNFSRYKNIIKYMYQHSGSVFYFEFEDFETAYGCASDMQEPFCLNKPIK